MTIEIGGKKEFVLEIEVYNKASLNPKDIMAHPYTIHTAFKCNVDTYFFKIPIQINHLLEVRGELAKMDYKKSWNQTKNSKVYPPIAVTAAMRNLDAYAKLLRENNIYVIQKKKSDNDEWLLHMSCRAANSMLCYYRLSCDGSTVEIEVRSDDPEILDLLYYGIIFVSN